MKICSGFIALLLSCAILFFVFFPMPSWAHQIIVEAPVANVRKGPSTDFPKVGVVYKKQSFEVYAQEGNWFKVKLPNDIEGWLWGELVQEKDNMNEDSSGHPDGIIGEDMENAEMCLRVIKPIVNIRQGPGTSYKQVATAKENDRLTGLAQEDGWYHCRTYEGIEGWIIDWACEVVPIHSQIAQSEQMRVIIKSDEVEVRAGPDETYPVLSSLSMGREAGVYLRQGRWLYVKVSGGQIEGWIDSYSVYDSKRLVDLSAWKKRILEIFEKLSQYYDSIKMQTRQYQDAGWYPSFVILQADKDIYIEHLSEGWRLELTVSIRRSSIDTLFPLSIETSPVYLSKSDRLFFLILIQALMENMACEEVEIRLKALKRQKASPSLRWVRAGAFILKRSRIAQIDLNKMDPDAFWDLLTHKAI